MDHVRGVRPSSIEVDSESKMLKIERSIVAPTPLLFGF